MSKSKLELVLEYLINEEPEQAADLLHNIVVEKSRAMYEELVDEDDDAEDEAVEESDDEELEEAFGGDTQDDFASDIKQDDEEIDSDEMYDGAEEGDEEGDEEGEGEEADGEFDGEGEVEDRVEDLEAALSDLRAEFDRLMSDELEEPEHDELANELGDEMGDEEMAMDAETDAGMSDMDAYEEGYQAGATVSEATKLQDQVADPALGTEGKLSGTGKNSKTGSVDKQSMYTTAPKKSMDANGGGPIKIKDGSDGKALDKTSKTDTPATNMDTKQKGESADMGTEGKYSGTGKNSKNGSVDKASPFTTAPKK